MALVNKLDDIRAWQEARKLMKGVYKLTASQPFGSDVGLRDKIQRAALSSMTNISEGYDCETKIELMGYLGVARRSVVEVQTLLYAALDLGYITQKTFKTEFTQAEKVKVIIAGLRRSIKAQEGL
jgi:four helix bundle protein